MLRNIMSAIVWEKTFEDAQAKAKTSGKPVLVDFYMIAWTSCESMDTVTYPNQGVADYIGNNFIPVRFNAQTNPEVKSKYRILWAPTILVLDSHGTEYYRFNGFLPPDEFIPQLEFGLGKMALEKQDIKAASAQFNMVVERYPKSDIAPESQYWVGVIAYQLTHDVNDEINEWKKITERYPNSIWAKKVSCAVSCIKE